MKPETDDQFLRAARGIAVGFINHCARLGMSPDETANLVGAALAEVLGQQLGPFGAVSRLRDMADVLEGQVLD